MSAEQGRSPENGATIFHVKGCCATDPRYTACSFALGRGDYCEGDVRFPHTHDARCPGFARVIPPAKGNPGGAS